MAEALRRSAWPTAQGGALEGIPLGIKDLFATEGVHTQACSHVLDGFKPRYELTVTANLWADGAVMLGKLNMDEFAMGSSNETSYYGPVVNPVARAPPGPSRHPQGEGGFVSAAAPPGAVSTMRLVPGGSSGGSAAAVAACAPAPPPPIPAARSASPRPSPAPSASSRPMAAARAGASSPSPPRSTRPGRSPATSRDAAILLKSMASVDPKDTTSVDRPVPDYEAAIGQSIKGMTHRHPAANTAIDGMPEEIEALWQTGHRLAEGCRRRDRRHLAAAHQIRAAGLLHRGAGRSLVQSRPL